MCNETIHSVSALTLNEPGCSTKMQKLSNGKHYFLLLKFVLAFIWFKFYIDGELSRQEYQSKQWKDRSNT
jgi:hypothetical protein